MAEINDSEEKKIMSNHIQTLIYPKYFKEDETSLSLNPDINKWIFLSSSEITEDKIKEFNAKILKIAEIIKNKQEFSLLKIKLSDVEQALSWDPNINTLCLIASQPDEKKPIKLTLYCKPEDTKDNRDRVLRVFRQNSPIEEKIKITFEGFNKEIFSDFLKAKEIRNGVMNSYSILEMNVIRGMLCI